MKAISIVAPGGQLIIAGKKTLEIRKWYPEISPDEDLLIVENQRYLLAEGDDDIGYAVAVVKDKNSTAVYRTRYRSCMCMHILMWAG